MKNNILRNTIRKIIVERIQLLQEGKKKFFIRLVNDKKMSQNNFESMFKPNGDFKYPFNDVHFRYVLFNTIDTGENHSFEDVVEIYETFRQQIFTPYNKVDLRDVRIPGESFRKYPINDIIKERTGTYDSLNEYIQILNSMNARTDVLQKILDKGFQGNKDHFEVIYEGNDWIIVYPKTYLGSIATARMGPDKKYYTPPKGIGKLSWCTSVDSAGNAFLNYHRRLNLHMYYFTKKEGFSKEDKYKKLCVSIAKKNNHISITKDTSTVDGENRNISEISLQTVLGDNLLGIIKTDASSPSRPEIDQESYYKSISIELYKDMRKANEENMSLFNQEVGRLVAHTENLEIVKEILQDPEKELVLTLMRGYRGQSEEITNFLYKNEDEIISRNPEVKNKGIFQNNKKYAYTITTEQFIKDLPDIKNPDSPRFYGLQSLGKSNQMVMLRNLIGYNKNYEIANIIIHSDASFLKSFLSACESRYGRQPLHLNPNYQKAIQDNIEYIIKRVPEVLSLDIENVFIPFDVAYKNFESKSLEEKLYLVLLRMCQPYDKDALNLQKNFIKSVFEEIIKTKNKKLATAVSFCFRMFKIQENQINKELVSKYGQSFESISNILSDENKSDEKIMKFINNQMYTEAIRYIDYTYKELWNSIDNVTGFRSIYYTFNKKSDEEPQLGNIPSEELKKVFINQFVMPKEDVLKIIKKEEKLSINSTGNKDELYLPIINVSEVFNSSKRALYGLFDNASVLYSFGDVDFSIEENLELEEYIKALNDFIMPEGYAIVSKPYFQEEASSDLVFPFGESSHLFNPDKAFIIKHYGDIFA